VSGYRNWGRPPDGDYNAASETEAIQAIRDMGATLHVPVMLGLPDGPPDTTGTCKRCDTDGLELWRSGGNQLCGPCWREHTAFLQRLSRKAA
jgi:hypothetical protein